MKFRSNGMMSWLMAGLVTMAAGQDEPGPETEAKVPEPMAESPFAAEDVIEGSADADPFAAPAYGLGSDLVRIPSVRLGEKRDTLQVRLEVWEVESLALTLAMDEIDGSGALADWRRERLDDDQSELVHAPVVVVDAKSRNSVEALVERIYPTEYEPPEILPDAVVEKLIAAKVPESLNDLISQLTSGATPTAFETRNTGVTFEAAVQPVTGESGSWDVSVAFEEVLRTRNESHGPEAMKVEMPEFSSFRSGGLLRVGEGRWQMVSVLAPPPQSEKSERRVSWVTLIRVTRAR